jgi:hypothetical protein
MTKRRDTSTMDLFDWEPVPIVEAFDPARVRAASLRAKISRAVSEAMKDCEHSRAVVAERMGEFMGEPVTENMLNAYASEAREDYSMPFIRLLGLIHATGDIRLMQLGAEMFGYSVIEDKFLPWVDLGIAADRKESVVKDFEYKRRLARAGVK